MGNEVSRKRWCFGNSEKSGRQEAERGKAEAGAPVPEKALMAVLGSCMNHLPKEKLPDPAAGTQNRDVGREREEASSPQQHVQEQVVQETVQINQLQELAEAQPPAEPSEEMEIKAASLLSPDRQTHAASWGSPVAAEWAAGVTRVTKASLPLRAAAATGARDAEEKATAQATVAGSSLVCKGPGDKLCKPSPLCRWLKKLRSSAEKNKAKPDATTSQE